MRRAHVAPEVLAAVIDGQLVLPADTAHRFFRVLRLPAGEKVELFDGGGRIARGALAPPSSLTEVELLEAADGLPPLVVVQAVTRTEKLELVVQKGTELGASTFVLFEAARGQVHLGDKAEKRVERLGRIAEDAARQSGRATVPSVEGPETMAVLAARVAAFGGVAVAGVVGATEPLSEVLARDKRVETGGLMVVVGPEGGLDPREIERLTGAGVIPVGLGAHVLRTETAALVALSAAQVALKLL